MREVKDMEKAKVCFTKKLMPDDVRRMYRILKKELPGRAAEMGYGGRAYELVCEE